jgi:hypothetical protein
MFSRFLLDLTTIVSAGIIGVHPIAELRASPPLVTEDGPVMTSAFPLQRYPQTVAVVQPIFEFRLVKASQLKRKTDDEVPRPAWLMLYFVLLRVLYLYHYDQMHVVTHYLSNAIVD